jgi:glycosyltransferase involved in cell wall biosynthesis
MKTPFFSVIIPTHDRPVLLRRALESIKSQRCDASCEVIVIADTSHPDTDEVCRGVLTHDDIYIRRNGKSGPAESRNLGLSLASGRYILFLDDDDAWQPNLLAQLLEQPEIRQGKFVYFDCSVVHESRFGQQPSFISETVLDLSNSLSEGIYIKNQIPIPCYAFPRELLENTSFDPHMRAYEDWDFLLQVFHMDIPVHLSILGSRVFEVHDESSDRRGNNENAKNFNAVMEYLYVYHRHPAPNETLQQLRTELLTKVGIEIPILVTSRTISDAI